MIDLIAHVEVSEDVIRVVNEVAISALPMCQEVSLKADGKELVNEIEIAIVSDEMISQVHGDFLNDATPTDVITFDHGEILISVDTAERFRKTANCSLEEELARYVVHGYLHLVGYEDANVEDQKLMFEKQEEILERAFDKIEK